MTSAYPDLAGKVAVVTGGSRGVGAATCRLLAAHGMKVVVNGRDQIAINLVVEAIQKEGGRVIGARADATDFGAIERMRRRTEEAFGPVDALFAFAGGHGDPIPTPEINEGQWRFVLDANLTSAFLTVKSFLPGMVDRRRGVIITMGSSAARLPSQASISYAAAKAGVIMFSRHLAHEVGPYGVRVNCIAPSAIRTERAQPAAEEAGQTLANFPLGRLGTPDDVAQAALFLASDKSSWITGVTLDVAGGKIIV